MVPFKRAPPIPRHPGMLRKSTAFVPRYQKFESISLQRRVGNERRASCEVGKAAPVARSAAWGVSVAGRWVEGDHHTVRLHDRNRMRMQLPGRQPRAFGARASGSRLELSLPLRQGVKWHDGKPFTGFDLNRFRAVAADADLRWMLLVPLTIVVEQIVRGWKWRQLLSPLRFMGSVYLFGAVMAGYLLAIVVPFGFGTVARSWLVAKREDIKFSTVLATVALDRLTDGIVFACLVPAAVLFVAFPDPGGVRAGLIWGGAGSLALFVALLAGLAVYRRQALDPPHG